MMLLQESNNVCVITTKLPAYPKIWFIFRKGANVEFFTENLSVIYGFDEVIKRQLGISNKMLEAFNEYSNNVQTLLGASRSGLVVIPASIHSHIRLLNNAINHFVHGTNSTLKYSKE